MGDTFTQLSPTEQSILQQAMAACIEDSASAHIAIAYRQGRRPRSYFVKDEETRQAVIMLEIAGFLVPIGQPDTSGYPDRIITLAGMEWIAAWNKRQRAECGEDEQVPASTPVTLPRATAQEIIGFLDVNTDPGCELLAARLKAELETALNQSSLSE